MVKQKGFTLIELMVVVAIIGIIAAIAFPSYATHVAKSKMVSALAEMNPGKLAIDDAINNNSTIAGGLSNYNLNSLSKNCSFTALTTNNVGVSSWIQCRLRNAPTQISGVTITLTRAAPSGIWSCTTTAEALYKPNGCN